MEKADDTEDFPVSDFLSSSVLNGTTIVRTPKWWSAVLVIQNPLSEKEYVALYRWQKQNDEWGRFSSFKINSDAHRLKTVEALKGLSGVLGWS